MNKSVDEYNNNYHCSIGKKPIDFNSFALTEETETNLKTPKLKFGELIRITRNKNTFSKSYIKNWRNNTKKNIFD